MGIDIAAIALGWLALLWSRVPVTAPLPLALQRLTVQPGSRTADLVHSLGFVMPGLGVLDLIMNWTDQQPTWLRILWLFVGFVAAFLVAACLLEGPRSVVNHALRRHRHSGTTEHRAPAKRRVAR
ncbi:MAG TPA: hypothetical protein VE442_02585 [Jatrophihabitans sp.]|jgi:hypothetical protein|nr:hypothetical protein [Jatrophihabitans sp.]